MSKKFAVALIALAMSVGMAHAAAMTHKPMHMRMHMRIGPCADNAAATHTCICGTAKGKASVCHKGQWCHAFSGACTQ